jgi:hypothetical protein
MFTEMCESTELEFHEQGTTSGNILSSGYPSTTAGIQRQPKRKTSDKNEEKAREKQDKNRNCRKKV